MTPNKRPVPKVAAGAAAGAVTTLLVYVASIYGVAVPAEVAAAVATLLGFVAAYVKRD
jgi:putative flippase GtrA